MKVVQVTKDNKTRDRGFIAVDAICSAFEDREQGNTQIMTMDGYWYEVLDDIEKVRNAVVNADIEVAVKEEWEQGQDAKAAEEPKSRIRDFYKKYKMPSPAISEEGGKPPMNRLPEPTGEVEFVTKKPYKPQYKRYGKYGRYGKSRVRVYTPKNNDSSTEKNLPAVSGKGQNDADPRRIDEAEAKSGELEGL